jgi:hypothetical protein
LLDDQGLVPRSGDPAKLARLADPRLKASPAQLCKALRGRVTKNHRFLLRLHLKQIDARSMQPSSRSIVGLRGMRVCLPSALAACRGLHQTSTL